MQRLNLIVSVRTNQYLCDTGQWIPVGFYEVWRDVRGSVALSPIGQTDSFYYLRENYSLENVETRSYVKSGNNLYIAI